MLLEYVKLKEIKPVLSGYIRESQIMLKISAIPDDKVVHDVRVLMKKSRAALKLAVPQLDREAVMRDIVDFREVGRTMALWRETSVLRKTLKELKKDFPDIFSRIEQNEKILNLLKKPEPAAEPPEDIKPRLDKINDLLNKTGFRIRFESMNKIDPQLLIKELEVTYLKVVDIYLKCRNNSKPSNMHEFRKKAKDFLYQLYFFRPLNPTAIKALEKKLDSLTQNLGKFNDLTQLVKAMDYKYPDITNLPAMDELVVKIREKQDIYLSKVWPSAYNIFCPGQKLLNVLGFKFLVI